MSRSSRARSRGRGTSTRKPWWYPTWKKLLGIGAGCFVAGLVLFGVAYAVTPIPSVSADIEAQSSIVRYADGSELGRLGTVNRREVPISRIPKHVQHAILAAENRTFYEDSGISPVAIARALWNNLRGGAQQGGSTITQQYVKYTRLTSERTYTRKLKEAILAIKIDQQYSKDEILGGYLNAIYFGRGAYGIQAAAQAYFGKDVNHITPEEGAVLASLVKSPSTFDPIENRERVEPRFRSVLNGMAEEGWLSQADARAAKYPHVDPPKETAGYDSPTRHLLETVRRELTTSKIGISEDEINRGGLDITTTFRREAVKSANRAVEKVWKQMDADGAAPPDDLWVGMSAVEPRTGKVVAIYGGRDYGARQYNDATQSRTQPGSTFKPFTLLAGLEEGIGLKSRFNGNQPREFPRYSKPVTNFGEESYGMIDLLKATESSVNTVYVDLGLTVAEKVEAEKGVENGFHDIADVAYRAGIPQDVKIQADPSLPLGTTAVSTLDLASAYATFAAQGDHVDPYIVEKVEQGDQTTYEADRPDPQRVFARDVMADLTYALEQVVEDGSGFAAKELGRPAAGKTGTSQENRSAWYAGYTPQLATTVSLFRDEGGKSQPLRGIGRFGSDEGMTGGSYPAQIWTAFMDGALAGKPVKKFPAPAYVGDALNPEPTPTATPTPTETLTPSPTPTPTLPTPTPTPSDTGPPFPGPSPTGSPTDGWPPIGGGKPRGGSTTDPTPQSSG